MRGILFDVTGTLLEVRGSVGRLYARVGRAHGLALDPAGVEARFVAALAGAPPLAFPGLAGDSLAQAELGWWREVVRRAAADPPPERLEGFFRDLYALFARPEAWRARPGAGGVLAELARRGYRLGALSNSDRRLAPLLAATGLAAHLAAIVTSVELGVAKPDPAAFHGALARLGVPPSAAAYVGDVPDVDGAGAARAGLLPVLVGAALPGGVRGFAVADLAGLLEVFPCRR